MSSIVWLAFAALLVVVVVLTRSAPKGGKPIANTRLMGAARYVLVLGVIVSAAVGVFGAIRH